MKTYKDFLTFKCNSEIKNFNYLHCDLIRDNFLTSNIVLEYKNKFTLYVVPNKIKAPKHFECVKIISQNAVFTFSGTMLYVYCKNIAVYKYKDEYVVVVKGANVLRKEVQEGNFMRVYHLKLDGEIVKTVMNKLGN